VGRRLSELLAPGPAAVAAELLTAAGVDRHGERVVVLDVDAGARWGYWSAVWLGTDPSDGLDRVGMEILEFGPVTSSPENVMTKDQPTGLYNRSALVAMLRTDQVARYDGVAFLDVYDFRAINDQYGIRAGDHCLRVIAGWLSTVAGPGDLLVRPSGDEFVVLASQILTLVAAVERLGWPAVVYDGAAIPVRLRMGWSARTDHASLAATARAADLALSAAKRNVTGSVLRHVPEMAHSMIRRAEQEQGLRASLDNPDGFTVAYQPIMDVRTGVPVGFEALLRTTTGRNVGPTDLIEAAERLGLAARLFDTALEVAVSRSASVLAGNDAALWLNLSRAQLLDDESVTNLLNALARYQVPHDRVVIEITERVVDEPSIQVAWVLDALRGKGIHFAVDDFGQGASNLAALQQFEVDIVKLDLSLLPRHGDDPRWRLVGAVERMLTSLELAVVAEGVETAVQSQRLVELGIHLQQGYLYGRPVTPDS
jgi:diguanylate cyclase (GGDEF)-like protein